MSGTLTRTLLNKLNPGVFGSVAQSLRAEAQKIEPEMTQFAKRLRNPGGGEEWTGAASDALQERAGTFERTYSEAHTRLNEAAGDCDHAKDYIYSSQQTAQLLIDAAEAEHRGYEVDGKHWDCGQPFTVADDFAVQIKPGALPSGAPVGLYNLLQSAAQEHETAIKRVAGHLEDLGNMWGAKIQQAIDVAHLALDAHGQPFPEHSHVVAKGIIDGTIPLPQDPHAMRELWDRLTIDEKNAIYGRYPDIGNHGGIPVVGKDGHGRDFYNRDHLNGKDGLIAHKQAEIDQWKAQHPEWSDQPPKAPMERESWFGWKAHLDKLNHDMAGYKSVQVATRPGQQPPRYLTIIDDKGHSAVTINNADTAKKVVALVPGTSADTAQMGAYDRRSNNILLAGVNESHGRLSASDISVTTWMGYDRPMDLGEAASRSYALNGAQQLDDFMDGIRASHDDAAAGGRASQIVIGHSYGTTEVGAAATGGHHLDADAVISLASPGMIANNAHGLSLNDGAQVYVAKNSNDPINIATAVDAHGVDPADWGDAYQIESAPRGDFYSGEAHQAYLEPGNPTLDNIGRIIDGTDSATNVRQHK